MKAMTRLKKMMSRFENDEDNPIRAQMNEDFAPLEALFQMHGYRGF